MMKKILKIQLLGVLFFGVNVTANTQSNCESLIGCKKKICHIESNIAMAQKTKNKSKEEGLQISLKEVKAHCTDDKLIEDLEDKIKDTKKDLQEDIKDYEKALKDNRPSKIEKYKTKMAKENKKIKKLEEELKAFQ